ncbi:fungal-specific transcription factor domain-domain-containing protein [Aspergillus taichungensis]|uniref:Fungal-specific transcription factor domain-domain-containing protein n=1 Tax=Aspergillus taichungensis TaxID=482145 RepID=A0A2J5HV59_9EURO|nr:fungal-specific transcription factor domain-domain-containing protein [Aspergillus taichungensis]
MMGKTFPTVRNQVDGSPRVAGQGPGVISSTSNGFLHDDFYQQRVAFPLIDPLFQDLSPSTRRYLSHFGSNFVKELVIYDVPDQNPVRQLLRYSREYPVLLQVIVATSAHHLYNISPSQTSVLRDALSSKGKALELLTAALGNIGRFDVNIMLAVVMLLIYFEWIQSGKNTWRIHLEGAKSLIRYIKCHAGKESTDSFAGLFVRRWLISEFLILDIIGSTASSTGSLETSIYGIEDGFDIDAILMIAEVNNFVSCPAKLMRHILSVAQMSAEPDQDGGQLAREEKITTILRCARQFDPAGWASGIQSLTPRNDYSPRTQIATAFKAATCLYVARMLPPDHPDSYSQDDRQELVSTVIDRLSNIHPDSELFKSTSWPCFVAGAEATAPEQRAWIMTYLQTISQVLPYKTYQTSMDTLEMIWNPGHHDHFLGNREKGDWVRTIKRLGVDLFIA